MNEANNLQLPTNPTLVIPDGGVALHIIKK